MTAEKKKPSGSPRFVNQVLRTEGALAASVATVLQGDAKGDDLRAAIVKKLGNALRTDRWPEWVVVGADRIVHLAPPLMHGKKMLEAEFAPQAATRLLYVGEGMGMRGEEEVTGLAKKLAEMDAWATAAGEYVILDLKWHEPVPALATYDRLVEESSEALDAEVLPPYER